jgi:2-phospho-L-lactate guanylyltransferase
MDTAIVIPLNAFAAAKSRLKGMLSTRDRALLVRWMAGRMLGAVAEVGLTDQAAVVSRDDDALAWAAARGVTPLRQGRGDLNAGLEEGRRWALDRGAQALLVLLGDLPYLTPTDIARLVILGESGNARQYAVLAPDRHNRGTNAMLLRPPAAIPFAFGEESFARHRTLARDLGVEVSVYRSPGTSRDVDTADDVRELAAGGLWRPADCMDVAAAAG